MVCNTLNSLGALWDSGEGHGKSWPRDGPGCGDPSRHREPQSCSEAGNPAAFLQSPELMRAMFFQVLGWLRAPPSVFPRWL